MVRCGVTRACGLFVELVDCAVVDELRPYRLTTPMLDYVESEFMKRANQAFLQTNVTFISPSIFERILKPKQNYVFWHKKCIGVSQPPAPSIFEN